MLAINNLKVMYGLITALQNISLNVPQGEIVSLVGPNGAGKSTTLKAIAGIVKPSDGEILLNGKSLGGRAPEDIVREGVALVPEGRHILTQLTVEENLLVGATIRKDRMAIKRDIDEMLVRFPILKERFKGSAGKLSGGEQQQLAVARALISRPKLLLLDEPSLGLSPMMTKQVFEILTRLHQEGITILLVEQFAEKAIELSDRTYLIRTGKILLSGTREELSSEAMQAAYLGA